jgi:transcriptional regulator with XRE-family HTH domain
MKLERSKQWWLAKAEREGDAAIGAGLLALDPDVEGFPASKDVAVTDESRIAFGRFVNLMRRRLGVSVERLAEVAALDASEILVIEDDVHHVPEPRTVYKLAQTFKVPQKKLMQIAGLTASSDPGLRQEAVRFAARSESLQKLTPEEAAALEAFVAVLSGQDTKKAK